MRDKYKSARVLPGRKLLAYEEARRVIRGNRWTHTMVFVLDFGCGPQFANRQQLIDSFKGTDAVSSVYGYDPASGNRGIEASENPRMACAVLPDTTFDIVVCSNVVNVQDNKHQRDKLMRKLLDVTHLNGVLVINYPKEPRYDESFSSDDFEAWLRKHWLLVHDAGKGVFSCYGQRNR